MSCAGDTATLQTTEEHFRTPDSNTVESVIGSEVKAFYRQSFPYKGKTWSVCLMRLGDTTGTRTTDSGPPLHLTVQ